MTAVIEHDTATSTAVHPATALIAGVCLVWYLVVILVSALGAFQIWRNYSSCPARSPIETSADCPQVTIIRPIKGADQNLYECLAATCCQSYPSDRTTIFLCLASRTDPALPIVEEVLRRFPGANAKLLIADEDKSAPRNQGPNPKICNMSQAYREAKGDIIWIIDSNAWAPSGACGRMVAKLLGRDGGANATPNKFVHHLPLVVETDSARSNSSASVWDYGGGRLEEAFMSSAHAKFYTAINTVAVAPCIVGKSNMFRKSHLDSLTGGQGIEYFGHYICEDHMIGDLLWKSTVPEERLGDQKFGKHALVYGDLAVQPVAGMSVKDYIARRTRWLRVRKWTVLAATLVEPGTESYLCSLFGAFGAVTLLRPSDFLARYSAISLMGLFWLCSVALWCAGDWVLYQHLHSGSTVAVDEHTPVFVRMSDTRRRRPLGSWVASWAGREALALPIWLFAVLGGGAVTWRGKRFWVGMDSKVYEHGRPSMRREPSVEAQNLLARDVREHSD